MFHEAGHIFFRPFGQWMTFLGGSLFQCVFPLVFAAYFLFWRHQPFSAAVCLWWCGQNFIDVAPYIGDARALELPLIGEWSDEMVDARADRHDWHNILEPIGLLGADRTIGLLAKVIGTAIMLKSWVWGGLLLWRQWRNVGGDVVRE